MDIKSKKVELNLKDLVELNRSLYFLSRGKVCLLQGFDRSNYLAYNTYACESVSCKDCLTKWLERNDV